MTNIFNKLPGVSYNTSEDRMIKAHMIKVSTNSGLAKVCDVVDLRLAAGHWQEISKEGLTVEDIDGPIDDFRMMYKILDGFHRAGLTWDQIKASLVDDETTWI